MSNARFTLSVDDGHPLDMRMATLLDKLGIQATFYLPIENSEGLPVLEPAAIRALAQRFEIGSHTRSHRFLTTLTAEDSWRQISEGKQLLEDCLGAQVRGFCYPGGYYRRIHLLQVRSIGFDYARTTQNLRMDRGSHPFKMPTSAQFYPHTSAVYLRNFVSQRNWLPRTAALRIALNEQDWLQRLHRLLDLAISNDAVFHLWCHCVDIERLQLWSVLDAFLRRIADEVTEGNRVCNGALFNAASPPAVAAAHGAPPAA